METTTPIYDKDLSLQLAGGKPDLAEQMLDMLLKELPQLCEQANAAAAANDADTLFRSVHKINGSTHYCGVHAIGEAAEEIEVEIKAGASDISASKPRQNENTKRLISLNR